MLKNLTPNGSESEGTRRSCMHASCYVLYSTLSCYSATALSDTSACQLHSFYTTTESPISAIDVILPFTHVFWWGTSPSACLVTLRRLESPDHQNFCFIQMTCSSLQVSKYLFWAVGPRLKGGHSRFNQSHREQGFDCVSQWSIGYGNLSLVILCSLGFMSTLHIIVSWFLSLINLCGGTEK